MPTPPRPVQPMRTIAVAAPAEAGRPPPPPVDATWRLGQVLLAPHRLGFFLAMVLLLASSLWWALVQVDRVSSAISLPYALGPSLVHAALMSFGFIPLFFSGFLFTAGPRWLNVAPWPVSALLAPLGLQAAGWLWWLGGGLWAEPVALLGVALASLGLVWMTLLFIRLLLRSQVPDRVHARCIAVACVVGCVSVLGLGVSLALGRDDLARNWVLTGLWGFVAVVYMVVAHRMIPFFTASALSGVAAWRPYSVLALILAVLGMQALLVWLPLLDGSPALVTLGWWLRCALELLAGVALLWLALRWGLWQSRHNRLLVMLHLGFSWLGLALLLSALSIGWGLWTAQGMVLGLGVLHALTMGCLGSLMLAMVTRVSCGHSGRPLVADGLFWALFWLLQLATALRLLGAAPWAQAPGLLAAAALLWAAIMLVWGLRLAGWYGRLRVDGKPD